MLPAMVIDFESPEVGLLAYSRGHSIQRAEAYHCRLWSYPPSAERLDTAELGPTVNRSVGELLGEM